MAEFKRIRVMVSSRCKSRVRDGESWVPMTEVRKRLQARLEDDDTLCGERLFDVWTSDAARDQSQGDLETAWEKSLAEVRKADMVLVLYTGEAGWAPKPGQIGICHAEFQEVWNNGPARLKIVRVPEIKLSRKDAAEKQRDREFQQYFGLLNPTSPEAGTAEEIVDRSREAVREAVASLVKLGGREARKGRFAYGTSLDWSRLDFANRKLTMEGALAEALEDQGAEHIGDYRLWTLAETPLLTICHGLPAAFGVAAAREMVGQPFLKDHEYMEKAIRRRDKPAGPVHLIACLKTVTENQAIRQLGFPDATIIVAPFGVYVSDPVQKIQMIFLSNCRDATTTRHAITRLVEWLDATGEAENLAHRAQGRRNIVKAILEQRPMS